jgi:predicted acyl esterase
MVLGAGLNRAKPSVIDPPSILTWTSEPLTSALDVVGDIALRLVAATTAIDTAWIVTLQNVAPDGAVEDVTAGWLRASLRQVDESASVDGAPVLPCRKAQAVPIGEYVGYRIPLVPNACRFNAGHRIRLTLSSDDQDPATPAIMNFRHASVGASCFNTVRSSSRLLLPVISAQTALITAETPQIAKACRRTAYGCGDRRSSRDEKPSPASDPAAPRRYGRPRVPAPARRGRPVRPTAPG